MMPMAMTIRAGTALALLAALAACGKTEDLAPRAGMAPPTKPATMAVAPTTQQLLTPSSQAQPERVDELLKKSEQRQDDRFDLPPPG
jgi:ABC-type glycerol-3-phosphate transport system substrate-binding protein